MNLGSPSCHCPFKGFLYGGALLCFTSHKVHCQYSAKNTNCKKFPFQEVLNIEMLISALFGRAVLVLKTSFYSKWGAAICK